MLQIQKAIHCGFASEVLKILQRKDKDQSTQSLQTGVKQLDQDVSLLKTLKASSLPSWVTLKGIASSNLGRGLFILPGSNQGYRSLMVFMSLKVFHIWAISLLYGSLRRPSSQTLWLS